jgi:dolichyl-phosphate-mannose--protein O-mannosyl transferase
MPSTKQTLWGKQTWLFLLFVLLLSYFTYFHRYWQPQAVFWDENYHIASAQKYLNGVFFMEPHPPLGKLLIAGGEWLLHPNKANNQYIGTDYATNFPADFSFAGYRLSSALLAWWTAPLLFLLFLLIFRNPIAATLLDFLYIFDNALIVHTRGAMLEGCLIFFSVLMMLTFFLLKEYHGDQKKFWTFSLLFGASFGAIMTTKLLGLLFILLVPAFLVLLWPNMRKMLTFAGLFLLGFLIVYIGVWQIHFSLTRKVVSTLPDAGYYQASDAYKQIIQSGTQGSITSFPTMIRDSWHFVTHYNAGTPRLDLCKKDENGSPFYFWPLGARTINYRWETPDGKSYRYLYLVANPVVWWGTFVGVLLAAAMLLSRVFNPSGEKLKNGYLLLVFLGLYAGFFVGISRIGRVLYLYHYFIALLIGFVIVALFIDELKKIWKWTFDENAKLIFLIIFTGFVFGGFQFYRAFSYYEPLTQDQFERRNILGLWELQCVGCEKKSGLVVPDK